MATITTILASDIIASSRVTLNTNFANLNTDKVDINSTYADPAWITSLAGSKITGNIGGNAATATALATARTIAGVSFDGTANIAIPSTGLSDSSDIVRGASSVASGQVLYGTGAGVAGSEANLFWDAANGRLGVGTNTPSVPLHVAVPDAMPFKLLIAGSTRAFRVTTNSTEAVLAGLDQTGFNSFQPLMFQATRITFNNGSADYARFATTGHLLLGTTTDDGTNRLQVAGNIIVNAGNSLRLQNAAANQFASMSLNASSIVTLNYPLSVGPSSALTSDVTLGVHNGTPTTGVTSVIVRAGAGQSTTNLTTWQNASGSSRLLVTSSLGLVALGTFLSVQDSAGSINRAIIQSTMDVNSSYSFNFSSTTDAGGAKDLSLSRAGVNIGQFGDGGSNSNGLLYLKGVRPVGSTVANLPTASGNTGMMATVTDATVTTIGTTVAGGGGNTVLVWSNGTNWRIYAN